MTQVSLLILSKRRIWWYEEHKHIHLSFNWIYWHLFHFVFRNGDEDSETKSVSKEDNEDRGKDGEGSEQSKETEEAQTTTEEKKDNCEDKDSGTDDDQDWCVKTAWFYDCNMHHLSNNH